MSRTTASAPVLRRTLSLCLLGLLLSACALPHASVPPGAGDRRFEVEFAIQGEGTLLIEFDREAAPLAVAALERSLREGNWQGLEIGWIRPHTEIRTGVPTGAAELDSELDAHALGLDEQRIVDAGEAMGIIQQELEPALLRAGAAASPQLLEWVRSWRAHFDAGFLVGTSRAEINEALGYRHTDGYASRPMRRGSVALVAATTPGRSTLALALLLRDQPARDGRWVVVGEIRSGLDLVERLSLAPRPNPKRYEPATPVRIAGTSLRPPRSRP